MSYVIKDSMGATLAHGRGYITRGRVRALRYPTARYVVARQHVPQRIAIARPWNRSAVSACKTVASLVVVAALLTVIGA